MSDLPPDPDANYAMGHGEDEEGGTVVPPSRTPLIPSESMPQFGCGFTLWLLVLPVVTPLLGYLLFQHWVEHSWVFSGVPLVGGMAVVVFVATKKRRWFGIGLLAGLLLFWPIFGALLSDFLIL